MTPEQFADRIMEIAVTGSIVRIDLGSFSATEKDANNQPRMELRQRVVMPAEGFVHSFALMSKVMQELEKRGLLRRGDASDPSEGASTAASPASPNFR